MTGDSSPVEGPELYRHAGFTGAFRLGARPAILVVDFSRGFTDSSFPLGADSEGSVLRTAAVLKAARAQGALVAFTTIGFDEGAAAATAWVRKVPSLAGLRIGSEWVDIDPRLGRREDEPIVVKTGASGFFGTPLASMLATRQIDTVIVLGATTSGCVRATVVDSVQHGYDTFVVKDCCADRAAGPHDANLFDMAAKYAEPLIAEEVVSYLQRLPTRR
jgi:maleamate amidohydrolase